MLRSQSQPFHIRWAVLASVLLHILAGGMLNILLSPAHSPVPPQESRPIGVYFAEVDDAHESLHGAVSSETESPAQMPKAVDTYLPPAPEGHVYSESQDIPEPTALQVSEIPKPPDARPPSVTSPSSIPPVVEKHPAARGHRKEPPPKTTPPTQQQLSSHLQKRPEVEPLAQLPKPAKQTPTDVLDQDGAANNPSERPPTGTMSGLDWRSGTIPLLSESDLDKYAHLIPSETERRAKLLSGLDTVISLNTKDIRYLSYFAHLKDKIEQVWSYPAEARAHKLQGQLLLLFVLQRSGRVKSIELLRSSGFKVFDKEAWDAVINAGPFDPFPPHIPQDELRIRARFSYVLEAVEQRTTLQ
jgi:protein TonB